MLNFILEEPEDGWTQYERMLMREAVVSIYKVIDDPLNKFILCITLECGYTQDEAARMLGISQVAINKRLAKTLEKIRNLKSEIYP